MSSTSSSFALKQRVAVLFSGGDAPGMNPFLRAFTRLGLNRHDADVWGVRDGYQGLVRAARRVANGEMSAEQFAARVESQRGLAGLRDRSLEMVSLGIGSSRKLMGSFGWCGVCWKRGS